MKRLFIAVAILVLVFTGTLYNAQFLNSFTTEVSDLLLRAEARAETGDWRAADKLTRQANKLWEDYTLYLHVFLRHADTDDVVVGFREVTQYLRTEEQGEYSAANARLVAEIGLLYEAEQLSIKNVL